MFKKPVGFEVVPHRMGGNHAKRDPLMDEKVGSAKRKKEEDLSHMAYYRETAEERKARIRGDKKAEKAGLSGFVAEAVVPETREAPQGQKRKASTLSLDKLGTFKDKLKSSNLAAEAAESEKKHKDSRTNALRGLVCHENTREGREATNRKDEIRKEEVEALAKSKAAAASSSSLGLAKPLSLGPAKPPSLGPAKPSPPDEDERITFAEIWKEGDEEGDSDWLTGGGLKFHTTADKAFSMDSKRFKESAAATGMSAENAEAEAERSRKRAEMRMAEFRRNQKG
mmetsp:Transcript_2277/g.8935  ORF Transcript_2277/g.8935 Transcript_2277/m.8935 type:complete len:283 (-) Transcript_2277:117-965(-)